MSDVVLDLDDLIRQTDWKEVDTPPRVNYWEEVDTPPRVNSTNADKSTFHPNPPAYTKEKGAACRHDDNINVYWGFSTSSFQCSTHLFTSYRQGSSSDWSLLTGGPS